MQKQPIRVLFCDDQPEAHIVCAIQQALCTFLGKVDKGGLNIRQKFWIMVQISVELRHPAAVEMLGKNGVVV